MDNEPREELTAESLGIACAETFGLVEAVCRLAPIKSVQELQAYLKCVQESPAHLRQLLEALKMGKQRR